MAERKVTREELLSDPRSGAKPLGGSSGAERPAAARSTTSRSTSGPARSSGSRRTPPPPEAKQIPRRTDLREAELHRTGVKPLTGARKREAEAGGYAPTPKSTRPRKQKISLKPNKVRVVTERSGGYSGKHVLTAELLAGLLIVLVRAVADYEPQHDGTVKGKIGHPEGQYGPLPIAAGLIASFFVLSFIVQKGGRWATVGNSFGALIILVLAMKSVKEFDDVAKTFGDWGKAKKPPGHWETSGPVAGQPVSGSSGGGGGSGSGSNAPVKPKKGKCPPGYTLHDGMCWVNNPFKNPEPM